MKRAQKMVSRSRQCGTPSGFTLVEMLVAVTLVLLMMTLFAQIFTLAADSVSTQRSIANNDQKVRALTTIVRADLDKRTMRSLISYFDGEDANTSPNSFGTRQGYFYLSTNDSADGIDTVLQFTVNSNIVVQNESDHPYSGRGAQVFNSDFLGSVTDQNGDGSVDIQDALLMNPNQPEADDARVEPNATAASSAAEISYFVRGGNLYRRVLLIREPLELAGRETRAQPTLVDGTDIFDIDGDPTTPDFFTLRYQAPGVGVLPNYYSEFDFGAYRLYDSSMSPPVPSSGARLHGLEALNNEAAGSTFFSLGKPPYRWGHNTLPSNGLFGQPREHTILPGQFSNEQPVFIGRFLHEETSNNAFLFPQGAFPVSNGIGDPMDARDVPLTATFDSRLALDEERDVVVGLQGGPRRAEELLMAGVHEFRVEIWDDRLRRFVDPSHNKSNAGEPGDYHVDRRWNPNYGPFADTGGTTGRFVNSVWDSWHPAAGTIGTGGPTPSEGDNSPPPFRAMTFYPPRVSDNPAGPAPASMPNPASRPGYRSYWRPNTPYAVGDIVFPATEDLNDNGHLDPGEDGVFGFPTEPAGTLPPAAGQPWPAPDTHAPSHPTGFAYHFRCVQPGNSGPMSNPPNWRNINGSLISEDTLTVDTNGDGVFDQVDGNPGQPNEAIWVAVPNLRPIRAIRLTIRVLDQGSERMRQVSITHSLID